MILPMEGDHEDSRGKTQSVGHSPVYIYNIPVRSTNPKKHPPRTPVDLWGATGIYYRRDGSMKFNGLEKMNYDRTTIPTCTLLIGNAILLIGYTNPKQIYQLQPRTLRLIGYLPFEFEKGRCINHANVIYFCFPYVPSENEFEDVYANTRKCRLRYKINYYIIIKI